MSGREHCVLPPELTHIFESSFRLPVEAQIPSPKRMTFVTLPA